MTKISQNRKGEQLMVDEQARIALAICNSEPFMWLMVGSNHTEMQLDAIRPAWKAFREAGGGWGR